MGAVYLQNTWASDVFNQIKIISTTYPLMAKAQDSLRKY